LARSIKPRQDQHIVDHARGIIDKLDDPVK
jgi:hypothetical protein